MPSNLEKKESKEFLKKRKMYVNCTICDANISYKEDYKIVCNKVNEKECYVCQRCARIFKKDQGIGIEII